MTFQFSIGTDSAHFWDYKKSSLIIDLPETLFFGSTKWSFALTEFNLSQSIVNVPAGEIRIDESPVQIPESCFTNIKDLISFMCSKHSEVSLNVRGSVISANFDQRRSKIVLNEPLRKILGFKSKTVRHGDVNSEPWDLWAHVPGIYLNWEAVSKQIYNNKYVKSVRRIPDFFKNVSYGKSIHFKDELPFFLDLEPMEITRIHIQLLKSDGQPLRLLPNAHLRMSFAFKND